MKDRFFFDTNILAYAFDKSERAKWGVCRKLVRDGFEGDSPSYVSNQVLAELFVVLTQKVARPLSMKRAGLLVKSFAVSESWKKLTYDQATVVRAAQDSDSVDAPFWDLLIAETMRDAGVKKIYTENTGDFEGISWVDAVDPFSGS
jgi:predicted nucleic acid-binding protein